MSATTWLIIAIVGFSLSGIALAAAVFMFIKMNIPSVIGDLTGKTVAREIKAMREANSSSGNKLHRSSSVNVNRGKLTEKAPDENTGSSVIAAAHTSKRLDKNVSEKPSPSNKDRIRERSSYKQQKPITTGSFADNVYEYDTSQSRSTAVLPQEKATDILENERKTDILENDRKTDILDEERKTDILSDASTAILTETRQTEILSDVHQIDNMSDNASESDERGGTTILSETNEITQDNIKPVAFKVTKSVIKIHTDEVI